MGSKELKTENCHKEECPTSLMVPTTIKHGNLAPISSM
jgi:hypothetical protein